MPLSLPNPNALQRAVIYECVELGLQDPSKNGVRDNNPRLDVPFVSSQAGVGGPTALLKVNQIPNRVLCQLCDMCSMRAKDAAITYDFERKLAVRRCDVL